MDIKLEIDDEEIPLNGFLERVLRNILEGIVKELHGVEEDWEKMKIKIER